MTTRRLFVTPLLLLMALIPLFGIAAPVVNIGDTAEAVAAKLGPPKSTGIVNDNTYFFYPNGAVRFADGKVASVHLKTPQQVADTQRQNRDGQRIRQQQLDVQMMKAERAEATARRNEERRMAATERENAAAKLALEEKPKRLLAERQQDDEFRRQLALIIFQQSLHDSSESRNRQESRHGYINSKTPFYAGPGVQTGPLNVNIVP